MMTYQYHDALDRFEAKERAMRAEAELADWKDIFPMCCCLELVGDDDKCPIHGLAAQECTCGPNDAPMCPSCKARGEHEEMPF